MQRVYIHFDPRAAFQHTREEKDNKARIFEYLEWQRSSWAALMANTLYIKDSTGQRTYQTLQEISQITLRDNLRMIPLCAICYRKVGQQDVFITIAAQPRIEEQTFMAITHYQVEPANDAKKICAFFFDPDTRAMGRVGNADDLVQVKWISACQLVPTDVFSSEYVKRGTGQPNEVEWSRVQVTPVTQTSLTPAHLSTALYSCGLQYLPARCFSTDALDPVEDIRYQFNIPMPPCDMKYASV